MEGLRRVEGGLAVLSEDAVVWVVVGRERLFVRIGPAVVLLVLLSLRGMLVMVVFLPVVLQVPLGLALLVVV